jgi:hypothetical protein
MNGAEKFFATHFVVKGAILGVFLSLFSVLGWIAAPILGSYFHRTALNAPKEYVTVSRWKIILFFSIGLLVGSLIFSPTWVYVFTTLNLNWAKTTIARTVMYTIIMPLLFLAGTVAHSLFIRFKKV